MLILQENIKGQAYKAHITRKLSDSGIWIKLPKGGPAQCSLLRRGRMEFHASKTFAMEDFHFGGSLIIMEGVEEEMFCGSGS